MTILRHLLLVLVLAAVLAACAKAAPRSGGPSPATTASVSATPVGPSPPPSSSTTAAGPPAEKPLPADASVPGDIPDTTQFVAFRSDAGHFSLRYPEGWAQQSGPASVTFTGTLNTISLSWMPATTAPTVVSATSQDVAQLQQTERAFTAGKVSAVSLPAGPAIEITYQANSEPNPVTGKQYRLDVQRFEFWRSGTEAVLTLSSPVGADNVDPWTTVSRSFAWL